MHLVYIAHLGYIAHVVQRAAALVLIGNNFGPLLHLKKGSEIYNMPCCTVVSHAVV